jgi:hypothetical protein
MEILPSDSELYLAIAKNLHTKRERKGRSSLLALLERDRENSWQFY